ncbi:MAG: AsmA-like C-terminal region-containing protein [Gallionella sp.]|nr:AsmA-like C-terminal region-containing protein [Gallionella sp.]
MNEKIIFVRTNSGEDEVRSRTAHLSKDIKRALLMVDGTASVAEIIRRASPSLRGMLEGMFTELAKGGFIQDKAKAASLSKLITPNRSGASPEKPAKEEDELDFTAAYRAPTPGILAEEAARAQAAARAAEAVLAEERARLEADAAKLKAQQAQERRDREVAVQQEAARVEAQEKVRAAAERREREEAEAARKAEQQAEQAKAEVAARAAAQERARLETEVARLKAQAEAEAKARAIAEERARQEAAQVQAKLAAEAERFKAEREAVEVQAREKAAQARLAAQQAEQIAREIAEAARVKTEQEVEKVKAEAESRARVEAERHALAAAEAARKAEQRAAEAQAEMEARARIVEQRAAAAQAETEARARIVEQEKARLEAEVATLRAQAEAEASARAEAAEQARQEAERLASEAQVARAQAEQEAERVREELEQVRRHAAASAREEAERMQAEAARVQQEAMEAIVKAQAVEVEAAGQAAREAARLEAQSREEAVHTNAEMLAALVLLNAKNEAAETSIFSALGQQQEAAARDPAQWVKREDTADNSTGIPVTERRKTRAAVSGCDSRGGNHGVPVVERRTTTAAVVFFDIAGYTKQHDSRQIELKQQFSQLLTKSLESLGVSERIILDTGDGAAVGFLQHPTDALEAAMHFRNALIANKHYDYPDLQVCIGINLGPVSLVKDINDHVNMLGDGINSAQRVMSFAGKDQIYVSRSYFDFVASLSEEYGDLFRYRGSQQDKHGREFQVYELLDAEVPADELRQTQENATAESSNALVSFDFEAFDAVLSQSSEQEAALPQLAELQKMDVAGQLLRDAIGLGQVEAPDSAAGPAADHQAVVGEPLSASAQAREYTEAEARQLADVQAKKWEEAAQRAAELARKNAQSPMLKVFQPPVEAAQPAKKSRLRRKPLPWAKLAAGLFVLLLSVLLLVPAVLPTQGYLTSMEQLLGSRLQQTVHIGNLSGRILPAPRLVLNDVSIGEARQIRSQQVRVNFAFSALLGSEKSIDSLELDGVQVNGEAWPQVADWLQRLAGDPQYPVARIILTQGELAASGIKFSDVEGQFNFDQTGKFELASLQAEGRKLALKMRATPQQKMQISFSLRDSALPWLPNWVFEELKAEGELTRDELRISDLDSRIMGGALTGEARINWRSGWRVQGALLAKVIPLQNISKLLVGDMDASARFQMQAESLSKLTDAALLNGVFTVNKGAISGMDMVETTRLRSRESLPGGRTHFDELSGELAYAGETYQFRKLKMKDSVVNASGTLTIARQQLAGNISANLAIRGGAVSLRVGGTTQSPSLQAVR